MFLRRLVTAAYVIASVVGCMATLLYLAGSFYLVKAGLHGSRATPMTLIRYWYWYGQNPDQAKMLLASISATGMGAALFAVPVTLVLALGGRQRRGLHGNARFADGSELRAAGLLRQDGILIGQLGRRWLRFGGQQFVLLAAPTRSGKGVSVVVPNLLTFGGSVVVLDIKQENYALTAGYRQSMGQSVYLFNPFSEDKVTCRYNPLDYVRDDLEFRVGDILALGNILYPSSGKSADGKDSFWYDQARNLFLGLVLLVCETPEIPRTLGEVLRQASGYGKPLAEYLNSVIKARWEAGRQVSPACQDALFRFLDNSDVTAASILATLNSVLTLWANPIVDAATSASDFSLTDVISKPLSIYIGVTPDHLVEAAPLINIFYSQLITLNMRALPQQNGRGNLQCLLLMDEFCALGKVEIIAKAIGFMAGYNLRLLTVIQSLAQLEAIYGPHDARTITTNHALQIVFAPREQKDAEEYSAMLGYVTERNASVNKSFFFSKNSSSSLTVSDQRRALLLPQEVKELGRNYLIAFLENVRPIRAEKIMYFSSRALKARVMPPPVQPAISLQAHFESLAASRQFSTQYVAHG